MLRKDLIIIGAGGHAHSVIDVVESGNDYRVRGLVDSTKTRGDQVFGYPVLGSLSDLEKLLSEGLCELFVAIGDNFHRHRIQQQVSTQIADVKFATVIHPRAYISNRARFGAGTTVMAAAVVNAGCQIGDGVIVNTGATVDHDCSVSSFASLAPNVSIGGGVSIGGRSSIGMGANVIHNVSLGHDVCVGAGSLILDDIAVDCVLAYGAPCKIVRQRRPDESYL